MLTLLRTLARGAAAQAREDAYDRHALLVLDQQIRETAADLGRGRRTLAAAVAGDGAEARRLADVEARAADLETRAVAALSAGREDLAREAAEAIANLEAERDALCRSRATFAAEVARMRAVLADATRRQAALERGRRVAAAAEAVRRLRRTPTVSGGASLREAEATLARLQRIQAEAVEADDALTAIETPEATIAERLESEGFGPRTRPCSDDVMARMRSRAEAARAGCV